MRIDYEPYSGWAFAWANGDKPFITCLFASTRYDLICRAEKEMGRKWKRVYRDGGRAVKCIVTERPK